MPGVRPAVPAIRTSAMALSVLLAIAGLVGVQAWQAPAAAASPTVAPTPTPTPASPASEAASEPTPRPTPRVDPAPVQHAEQSRPVGPQLTVTQAVSPAADSRPGRLAWTSVVTNAGDTGLNRLSVTDASTRLSVRSCAPVVLGGALAVGASTTCTATSVITQDDLDHGRDARDAVTATAASTVDGTRATASATATAAVTAAAGLSLAATASPATVSRVGQQVGYVVLVRNRGVQTLVDLVVRAPAPGLAALFCAPVPLGGALAPGTTTTCRATRTVAVGDLRSSSHADAVKASAHTVTGQGADAATQVVITTAAPGPVAVDDTVGAVANGPVVYLPGSANDHPGEADGPGIDPSRTIFLDPGTVGVEENGKLGITKNGLWDVEPDGSIRLRAYASFSGTVTPRSNQISYRVYDLAGRSAVGHLTVYLRKPATTAPEDAYPGPQPFHTVRNQPVTADVLSRDDPGQNADGTPGSFDPTTLVLVDLHPKLNAVTYADHKTIRIGRVGDYTAGADGRITFAPAPNFLGTPPRLYFEVRTLAGSLIHDDVEFRVDDVVSPLNPLTASVAYGHPALLAVASSGAAGSPDSPVDPATVRLTSLTATNGGKALNTYRGTWTVEADGSLRFLPVDGFVGTTAPIDFTVDLQDRSEFSSSATVTVRPGPLARPDLVTGPRGSVVVATPLVNDVAGLEPDGSAGSLVVSSVVFPVGGQPAGSAVAGQGRTLTVPGEGLWTVASGTVSFHPDGSFVGGATPVSYQVSDDHGAVATGRLTVAVTSDAPAATDDEAATTFDTPVRLAAATDDSPGASLLVPGSTVFPTAGQPASGSVSADGKTLAVPGEGSWSIAQEGSVTFAPTKTYAGTTSPVIYRVVDGDGVVATATLRVVVRPGPVARPDVHTVTGTRDRLSLDDNDTPGRNADGTLGSIASTAYRAALTGQPAGWVVDSYRSSISYLAPGENTYREYYFASSAAVYAPDDFEGPMDAVAYTAQDTVIDGTGAVRHNAMRSAVQVTFDRPGPIATDDHAVTTTQVPAMLAAESDDITTAFFLDGRGLSFPGDQLSRLPRGSVVSHGGVTLDVPGEGTYQARRNFLDVTFTPAPGFVGDVTPVQYRIADQQGNTARATLTVTVLPGAIARPDVATTPQGRAVKVDVRANDDLGSGLVGAPATWSDSPQEPYFTDPQRGVPSAQLSVPGQGTFSWDGRAGSATFTPDPGFRGTSRPITVTQVIDVPVAVTFARETLSRGPSTEISVSSTVQVTVLPVDPVAGPDRATSVAGQPVVIPVLGDDAAGSAVVPLVTTSVRLRLVAGLPSDAVLYGDAKTLVVPGRGVFLVSGTAQITFVPLGAHAGPPLVVGYSVADVNQTTAHTSVTVSTSG